MFEPNLRDFEDAFQEKKELGFLEQLAGGVGTHMALSTLAKFLPGHWKIPPLVLSAIAGGTWGGIKSGLEGKRFTQYPGEIASHALMFGSPLAYSAYDASQELFKTAIGRQTPEEFGENLITGVLPGIGLGAYFARRGAVKGHRDFLDPMLYRGFKQAWEENKGKALKDIIKAGGEKTWEGLRPEREQIYNYPLPQSWRKIAGAHTLGEVVYDPERRVAEKVGTAILAKQSVMGNIQEAVGQLTKNLENASPQDRLNVARAFKSDYLWKVDPEKKTGFWKDLTPGEYERMLTILKPFRAFPEKARVKGLIDFGKLEDHYMMDKISGYMKNSMSTTPVDALLFRDLKAKLVHTSTPQEAQQALKQIMLDPTIEPKMQEMAKSLYNLPSKTNYDILRAWERATADMVKARVKGMPGQVLNHKEWLKIPEEHRDSFVFVDRKETGFLKDFRGQWVERNTYHQFLDYDNVETMAKGLVNVVNRYTMQPWKVMVAVARFPTLFRNLFGNFWLNSVNGKHPIGLGEVEFYKGVLDDMGTRFPEKMGYVPIGKGKKGIPATYVTRFFELAGENAGTWIREEVTPAQLYKNFKDSLHGSKSIGEAFLNLFNTGMSPFTDLYAFSEVFAKVAKFKWNLGKGMDEISAVKDALQATFNYGSVSKGIGFLRSTLFPFATFNSKVISTLPEAIVKNPMILAKWIMVPWMASQMALEAMDISEPEWEQIKRDLPDYLSQGMYFILPFRDEKNRIQMINMSWWLPGLGDLSEMINTASSPGRLVQHPLINLAADVRNNTQGATDIPIYHEWEPPVVKLGKIFGHIFKTFTPTVTPGGGQEAMFPGGIDYNLMVDAIKGRPNALTVPQAISSLAGLKTVAIDEGVTRYRKEVRIKQVQRDMTANMRRELRNAVKDEEREEIAEKYAKYLGVLSKL